MSKKATIGMSPKDRSMNIIDKFIQRSDKKEKYKERLPARRKAKDVPMDLWPLKDQIEYWENQTTTQKFDRKYTSYIDWFYMLEEISGQYHTTFIDQVSNHKERLTELFNTKMLPKDALELLRKEGIIWI
tara:strand:+ start:193 stop:582 length:390 start_codon:yes stop_codon:yes gene_type:complete